MPAAKSSGAPPGTLSASGNVHENAKQEPSVTIDVSGEGIETERFINELVSRYVKTVAMIRPDDPKAQRLVAHLKMSTDEAKATEADREYGASLAADKSS